MVKFGRGAKASGNIEDRRGVRAGGLAVGGGGLAAVILLVVQLLSGGGGGGGGGLADIIGSSLNPTQTEGQVPAGQEDEIELLSKALTSIEQYWSDQLGADFRPATLVFFSQSVATGCGNATSAVGPFYCPPDEKAYIDVDFFEELSRRFGAPGDFAQVYVLA
ncbi:MAG: neutral zinc metallopeptidase, partial [Acidimicrobiia bacterium]